MNVILGTSDGGQIEFFIKDNMFHMASRVLNEKGNLIKVYELIVDINAVKVFAGKILELVEKHRLEKSLSRD